MALFSPKPLHTWESHSAHMRRDAADLYVQADKSMQAVRLSAQGTDTGCSMRLSASEARALAAELITAANSLTGKS